MPSLAQTAQAQEHSRMRFEKKQPPRNGPGRYRLENKAGRWPPAPKKKNMGLSASWLDGIWQTVKHTYAVQNTSVSTTLYGLGHDFIIMFSTNLVLFGIWAVQVHINQCTDVSGFLGYIPVHSASHIWPLRTDQLFRHFAV